MEILMPLLGIAVLSAVVGALAYDGKTKKIVGAAIGVMFLSVAVDVLSQSADAFSSALTAYRESAEQSIGILGEITVYNVEKETIEQTLAAYLAEECGLEAEEILVTAVNFQAETAKADAYKILLRGKARYADAVKIRELAEKAVSGKCEVDIEIG